MAEEYETPAEWFRRTLEEFKKANPNDPLNKPYESEFFKSGKGQKLIEDMANPTNTKK